MNIINLFQFEFVWFAYIAILLISVMCGILGNFLVLGRMSSLGDALSHIAFGSISLSVALNLIPTVAALIFVILAAILLDRLSRIDSLYGEAAVTITSLFAISTGIIASSLAKTSSADTFSYLFGSALLVTKHDLLWLSILVLSVLTVVFLFYWDFLYIVFNIQGGGSRYSSKKRTYELLFRVLVSIAIFCATKFLGSILVSSLLIVPACISMKMIRGFAASLVMCIALSILIGILGLTLGIAINLPIGAAVAFVATLGFLLFLVFEKSIKKCA